MSRCRQARRGFTIIEIGVIFIIIALMLLIIVPHFLLVLKGRKAPRIRADAMALNSALEHYALDNGKTAGSEVQFADLRKYLDASTDVYKLNGRDVMDDPFGPFVVGDRVTVPLATQEKLSSVTSRDYWSPYQ
jgi:type II secretory pathway pseudopilin PulG